MSRHEGKHSSSTMAQSITLLLGFFIAQLHFSLFHGNGDKMHHWSCADCVENYSVGMKVLLRYASIYIDFKSFPFHFFYVSMHTSNGF